MDLLLYNILTGVKEGCISVDWAYEHINKLMGQANDLAFLKGQKEELEKLDKQLCKLTSQ